MLKSPIARIDRGNGGGGGGGSVINDLVLKQGLLPGTFVDGRAVLMPMPPTADNWKGMSPGALIQQGVMTGVTITQNSSVVHHYEMVVCPKDGSIEKLGAMIRYTGSPANQLYIDIHEYDANDVFRVGDSLLSVPMQMANDNSGFAYRELVLPEPITVVAGQLIFVRYSLLADPSSIDRSGVGTSSYNWFGPGSVLATAGYRMFAGGSTLTSSGTRNQLNQYCFLDLYYDGDAVPSAPKNFARNCSFGAATRSSTQGIAVRFTPNDTFIANFASAIAYPTTAANLMRYSLCKGNATTFPFTLVDKDVIWQKIINPSQFYSEQSINTGWLMLDEEVTLEGGQEYTMIADTMFATTTVNSISQSILTETFTAIAYPSADSNLLEPLSNLHYTILSSNDSFLQQASSQTSIVFGYKDKDQIFGT